MSSSSKIKQWIASLKSKKHLEIAIAVIAVALMLILYFSTKITLPKASASTEQESVENYCTKTERELATALESMQGVGKVQIVISWESGVEKVIAYATNQSGNNVSTTPTIVQTQGSSTPIVLKELYPKALGAIIICQGGNNVAVKLDVIHAVSTLLNVSQNNVNVYAMK